MKVPAALSRKESILSPGNELIVIIAPKTPKNRLD
jgi:hypothetical protein